MGRSPEFVTADGSPEPSGKATAKLTWDDFYLYVFITIADTDVSSPYKNHDDPLWKADAVEMFVDADGNRAGYIELQVNPHNTTFDSWFAGPRGSHGDAAVHRSDKSQRELQLGRSAEALLQPGRNADYTRQFPVRDQRGDHRAEA